MNDLQKWTTRFTLHIFLSLMLSFIGMIVGMIFLPPSAAYFCSFILIGILVVTSFLKKDRSISMLFAYLFFFIDGITLFPIVSYYLGVSGGTYLLAIFLLTLTIVAALSLYGYFTKGNIDSWGGVLFAILLGLLLVSIVNIFLSNTALDFIISLVGVILFSLYIIFDVNKFKKYVLAGAIRETRDLSWHVINVYLDIINLFLYLLRLFKD